MSAPTVKKRKMGFTTLFSAIFILIALVWALVSFVIVQGGLGRTYEPHEPFEEIEPWPYNIQWAGGRANWFDNINYTDLPLNMTLPEELLENFDQVLFVVNPADPPQLWRSSSYDNYDGSGWHKTLPDNTQPLITVTQSFAQSQGNTIYTVTQNVSAGATVGFIELPSLFPEAQIIEGSFRSNPASALEDYTLEIDDYGTVQFSPLIQGGQANDTVLISYDLTYADQDLNYLETNARPASFVPLNIIQDWGSLDDVTLTQAVLDDIDQFRNLGTNAYEKALAVDLYFKTSFDLILNLTDRPGSGQEVTDWFLARGGGLPMDFATAYSVYMRELGIPARMVTGYAVGDQVNNDRVIRVRHMMFWVEVFIPTPEPEGGQWMQVVPIGLPPDMGGGTDPENAGVGNISLYVTPFPLPWALVNDSFNVYSWILVEGIPITLPETIAFYDLTDGEFMGTEQIDPLLGIANITYQFPMNASIGVHIIAAIWQTDTFSVTNYTTVNAVAYANPYNPSAAEPPSDVIESSSSFIPSGTVDVDLALGNDDFIGYWEDTVLVHGIMTVGGNPVDGGNLTNDQVQILWDGLWIGNATIGSDGYYELPITLTATDIRFITGLHEVWAAYAGEYDDLGFPLIFPGESADRSTVDVWGTVGFTFTVTPVDAYAGASLTYSGTAYLLNGTPLSGQTIGLIFDGSIVNTDITTGSGDFQENYTIPGGQASGLYDAWVNYTSVLDHIAGNNSYYIQINVQSGTTNLTIDSVPVDPQAVIIGYDITIFGYLQIQANGTGIGGKTIDIYWEDGTGVNYLGSITTEADGYYEFTYTVPASSEGMVTYWTEFPTGDPIWLSSRSPNMTIQVKPWDIVVNLYLDVNPVIRGYNVTFYGNVTLPEWGGAALGGVPVTIWWQNSTQLENLTATLSSGVTGQYSFEYQVPINHDVEIVSVWAEFVSPAPSIASNDSTHLGLSVEVYQSYLTLFSNRTYFHLNETAHIWGQLTYDGGIPQAFRTIYLDWDNTSVFLDYPITTNSSGWFDFYYNYSLGQDTPDILVDAIFDFTSLNRSIGNVTTIKSLYQQLYNLTISDVYTDPAHLDEVIQYSGILYFDEGLIPAAGQSITIWYRNSTHLLSYIKTTNSSGGFYFQYNLTMNDALGAVYIWSRFTSFNPLWNNAGSANNTVNLIRYLFDLTINTNGTAFHLDEVVQVSGTLTYQHNGTPLAGQEIYVHWDNGTENVFGPYITDGTGYYEFFYNCSVGQDDTHPGVDIWVNFLSLNPMWQNTTSGTLNRPLNRYSFDLTISTGATTYYLDQTVHVYGLLTYQTNATILVGWDVTVIWDWNNGTQIFYTGLTTNSSGYYNLYRSLVPGDDPVTTVTLSASFTNTNPLWNNATSGTTNIDLDKYTTILIVTPSVSPHYLNETVTLMGSLTFQNLTAIQFENVSLYWRFSNATEIFIGWQLTDGSGTFTFLYSEMDNFLDLSGEIRGRYFGNALLNSDASSYQAVILQRWSTVFSSFGLVGGSTYHPTETVVINANLDYVSGPTALAYANVSVLFAGFNIASNFTQSDGSFIFSFNIGSSFPPGIYDITLEYYSPVNWIANTVTATPETITITTFTLTWSILVVPDIPAVAYLDGQLDISGTLEIENGTPYADQTVILYWDFSTDADTWIEIFQVTTDGTGYFQHVFWLDDGLPVGLADVRAFCTPDDAYVSSGYSSTETINLQQVPVNIEASVTLPPVLYRSDSVTITGYLTYGTNGSAMVGHTVNLVWNSIIVDSTIVVDTIQGYYEINYDVPDNYPLGPSDFYVEIDRTIRQDIRYNSSSSNFPDIYDLVELHLDTEPSSYTLRYDDLTISGWVENGAGYGGFVPLNITLSGGYGTIEYTTSFSNGTFSEDIMMDMARGAYTLTIGIDSLDPLYLYYHLSSSPDTWDIEIYSATTLDVIFTQVSDIQPGESFWVQLDLQDDDGVSLNSVTVRLLLNDTNLGDFVIDSNVQFEIVVPSSEITSGLYVLQAGYAGGSYLEGSTDDTRPVSIHIFTEVVFERLTPQVILPNQTLNIEGRLYDSSDALTRLPIVGRNVEITLNDTLITVVETTNSEGYFRYTVRPTPSQEGSYSFELTLLSSVNDITLPTTYIVEIQETGDIMQQLGDLIPFIALAGAVVVVLLYLYFVKGMFRSVITTTSVDITTKLRNIQKLRDAGKYSAAITLAYRTFEQLCGIKIGSERLHSETAREYLERVLKQLPLDAVVIEEFVQAYEEARFSDHEITRERFDRAIKIFTDIYPRIEGSTPIAPTTSE